jgi:hypothetical protein
MSTKTWVLAALAAVAVAAGPARSQEKLDKYSLQAWGGTWMSDCADNKSPRVTVFEEALVFLRGDTRVAGGNFRAAASWMGISPPEDYVVALLSELPGEKQFLAIVYRDELGEYITLEGDPDVRAQIGEPALAMKYRKCTAAAATPAAPAEKPATAASPATGTKPAPSAPAASGEMPDAIAMMADSAFKAAYAKALGPYAGEEWLAKLDGPSSPSKKVKVAKNEYLLVNSCKNHDCYDSNTLMLYSSAKKLVYGKVVVGGKHGLFGNPPPAVSKELETMWRAQWRSSP